MKVTTDGCLFGAIAAHELRNEGSCRVLDVGAGTGLLSLMVAQENEAAIVDGVELDAAAAGQARENAAASPWSKRVGMQQADILQYERPRQYDFIISNPPFYEQQLGSPHAGRQMAHHSSGLTLPSLFQRVKLLLKEEGKFFVLLPFYRTGEAIALAKDHRLLAQKQWLIRQTPRHAFFRTIVCFGKEEVKPQSPLVITIREETGNYSAAFAELLRPYYLHL